MSSKLDQDSLHTTTVICMYGKVSESTAGNVTYSSSDFLHTIIERDASGSPRTDSTPTASAIVTALSALNSAVQDESSVWSFFRNAGSETITLAAGAGVSLYGATDIAAGEIASLLIRVADASPAAVEVYVM